MQIALTGGTGFIGNYLTNKFVENDHQVVVLTRDPNILKNPYLRLTTFNGILKIHNSNCMV